MTARTTEPRDTRELVSDFAAGAWHLNNLGTDWRAGGIKQGDLTVAANALHGLQRLLTELRQGVRQ